MPMTLAHSERPALSTFTYATLLIPLLLVACSSTPQQVTTTNDGDGGAIFDGNLDPALGTFVLQRLEIDPPDREPLAIELIGHDLVVNPDEWLVEIQVAMRNASERPLYPSVNVALYGLDPSDVSVENADGVDSTYAPGQPEPVLAFLYDYSDLLGNDHVLSPGETSGSKRWVFAVPDLGPFSFGAVVLFGLGQPHAQISGAAWWDDNRNGRFDSREEPAYGAAIHLLSPSGGALLVRVGETGHYSIPVREVGLYRASLQIPLHHLPLCFSTPHPLSIVLPSDPEGLPQSYEDADFGLLPWPCPGQDSTIVDCPVVITDLPMHEIEQDFYHLEEMDLDGDWLTLRVGYSGCQPDHPFRLQISGDFMESNPVQSWAVLQHDDLGELCAAHWMRALRCDLQPLREAYIQAYGAPGVVVIQYHDFNGDVQLLEFGP